MLEIAFFAATVAGSSGSGFRSRYSAHCEGERWEGGGVRERRAGEEGTSFDSSWWGEQSGEPRDSRVRRWKEAAAAQDIPRCISAEEQERARPARRGRKV